MYHFLFVPLTLGLSFMLVIMETCYVVTGSVGTRQTHERAGARREFKAGKKQPFAALKIELFGSQCGQFLTLGHQLKG